MPDTPLNQDALAHARSAAFDCWESGGNMDDLTACAIEAYLAVAQTEVTSVEELDALPAMSVVLDVYGASVTKIGYATWVRASTAISDGRMFHVPYLPALVLYRPEVNDGR